MSYDIDFLIDTGGAELHNVASLNYTSNCRPMFDLAIDAGGLWALHGKGARYCVDTLQAALDHMREYPELYRPFNPPNGWGDYDTALLFLQALHGACVAHPNTFISVSA